MKKKRKIQKSFQARFKITGDKQNIINPITCYLDAKVDTTIYPLTYTLHNMLYSPTSEQY